MRVLVPWRAFGDLARCTALIPQHEEALIGEIEHDRDTALRELDDSYGPFLAPLPQLRKEFTECEAFLGQQPPEDKEERKAFREQKKAKAARFKDLKRELKALERLKVEAEEKKAGVRQQAEREIALARETATDLSRICADPKEACRYFIVADRAEIEDNEFNLNLPRYVDTFEPEEQIEISDALSVLSSASSDFTQRLGELCRLLRANGGGEI